MAKKSVIYACVECGNQATKWLGRCPECNAWNSYAQEDAPAARRAVERIGLRVSDEREVVVVPVEDHPGGAAAVLRRVGDADINLELAYQATGSRLLLGVGDLAKFRTVVIPALESAAR